MKCHLAGPTATARLAARLNSVLPPDTAGWTLLLDGELGASKSTFGAVPSPTYTLVEPYELSGRVVYHVDLYRISDEEELRYLGWTELEDGLRIIEWPDRAPDLLASADLKLVLHYANRGRDAEIIALSPRGAALIAELEDAPDTKQQD